MGLFIRLAPVVEVETVESHRFRAERNFRQARAHLQIELVAVNAAIRRCVALADEAGKDMGGHD